MSFLCRARVRRHKCICGSRCPRVHKSLLHQGQAGWLGLHMVSLRAAFSPARFFSVTWTRPLGGSQTQGGNGQHEP
eukprot:CAMPEP_0115354120 /NCGR_PEP_ID=MMETSP0270-20121206/98416_1 /TAXON_ID=71861 /ORGANISM="Scrippsiella trochoidea, Strain CCMP3099" /LENGTH=75 /DNA_ID=CAMNT_0002776431 /DNA_START=56 /DNA_END=283 /DNA_ORIENTATION=+